MDQFAVQRTEQVSERLRQIFARIGCDGTALLRKPDVCKIIHVSMPTLYRWIRIGHFPKPHRYGPKLTGWTPKQVQDWLTEKTTQRDVA
jgi:predicted DNA-binding transcriptional regulator AlpA